MFSCVTSMRFVLGGVCAADDGDLVIAGIGAAGNSNALALEETIGEPTCAVGAREAIERFAGDSGRMPVVKVTLPSQNPRGEVADAGIDERAVSAGEGDL